MGFGDFLSKAAKFAGSAMSAIANELVDQGPTTLNKNILDKAIKLNLNYDQRSKVQHAELLNNKLSSQKRVSRDASDKIKSNSKKLVILKSEIEKNAFSLLNLCANKLDKPSDFQIQKNNNISFVVPTNFDNGDPFEIDAGKVSTLLEVYEFCDSLSLELGVNDSKNKSLKIISEFFEINGVITMEDDIFSDINDGVLKYKKSKNELSSKTDLFDEEKNRLSSLIEESKVKEKEISEELNPLMIDIRDFCRPLMNNNRS